MGGKLSKPVTEKETEFSETEKYIIASSGMQGWRESMEDAHFASDSIEGYPGFAFFGVFDGHCGTSVSHGLKEHLQKTVFATPEFQAGNYEAALIKGFIETDKIVEKKDVGSTAVCALIVPDGRIFVANAGDSRAIIVTKGMASPLSFDHKPTLAKEKDRIQAAGGFVQAGRVNGAISLSRAFGDHAYKGNSSRDVNSQIIICVPDVIVHEISPDDEYMVLACDGIWDVHSNQGLADLIADNLKSKLTLPSALENILDNSYAPSAYAEPGGDNMTLLVVGLKHGSTLEQWTKKVINSANHTSSSSSSSPQRK